MEEAFLDRLNLEGGGGSAQACLKEDGDKELIQLKGDVSRRNG